MSTDKVKSISPLKVIVKDRGKIKGTQMIKGFTWSMQGKWHSAYVILFPLVWCDLILGMQWLGTLGSITWDCLNLTMDYNKDG